MLTQCPECQTDNPPEARFCMHCGAALPRRCPTCGTALPAKARFCMSCGRQVAMDVPVSTPAPAEGNAPPLSGERRLATVLLADIKGSTDLAERVDTESWVEIMNRVFQVLGAEIYRYGGEIDQYRGDGLVAFFGVPAAHEDDAERAVLAALAMQEAIRRYAAELAKREGADTERPIELLLRVGLNTGEVIAAHVGDDRQHGEDTAMGRAIALAARMETAAEPGTVLVTEDTYRLVAPLFEWQSLGEIAVQGVSQPVAVYRPLARQGVAGKGRGIEGLESPLVGRDTEFRVLGEAVERLGDGLGGIVTVVGEAGLGKSRLVAEIRKLALSAGEGSEHLKSPNLRWVEGRCLSYATTVAYGLWIDGLRALLGSAPDAAPSDVRRRLKEWAQALCPDCVDQVYPYLGRMLSLPLEEEAAAHLRGIEAQGLKVLTFRAVETLVQRIVQERPLVAVCEDLHWADATSLELLAALLPLAERAPLLLVCVLRPEREHGCWQVRETAARRYPHRHSDLWLEPLSPAESGELVRNLLRVEDLPEALRARILERAEGNPFYVEEILRSLIDSGIVGHDEASGRWRATQEADEIPIPEALQGVLRARIDRLPEEVRRVLQTASVIGRIFSYRVLEAVVGAGSPLSPWGEGSGVRGKTLDTHLFTLQREQMIREQAHYPERQYAFKHYLTVEAAYGGLLRRERRVTHRRVAETLERLYPERVEEQLGLLAHHWERAKDVERAVEYLQRAGEQAASQYANEEAIGYLSRALDLFAGADAERRYVLLLARERVHDLCGNRGAQQRDLVDLKNIAGTLSDDRKSAEIALREANYALLVTSDHAALVAAAQRAIRHARLAGDLATEAESYMLWGRGHYLSSGKGIDAVSKLEQALRLSRAAHCAAVEANSLRELGLLAAVQGDSAAAVSYHKQSLQAFRDSGNRMGEGRALNALGDAYLYASDYASARTYTEQGLRLCRETGNRFEEAWALHHLGWASTGQAEYGTACICYERSLRIFRDVGNQYGESILLGELGGLFRRLGDYAQAGAYYERALNTGHVTGTNQAWMLAGLGLLYHHLGEDEAAHERCQQAIDIAQSRGDRPSTSALTGLGNALAGLGRLDEAVDAYRRAVRLRREQGQNILDPEPLAGLARVALAQEQQASALVYVKEILSCLEIHPKLEGAQEPLRVYLTCYRVLRTDKDPRATALLDAAYRLLQERALKVEDEALRRSYLENVAAHREIVHAWEGTSQR